MTRRLFTLAALLSLLICAATASAWAWSSLIQPLQLAWGDPKGATRYTFCVAVGALVIQEDWAVQPTRLTPEQLAAYDNFQIHHGATFHRLGIQVERAVLANGELTGAGAISGTYQKWGRFSVVLWWPLLVTLPLPLVLVYRISHAYVRRWRLARSLCVGCGYDMRATPGRCTECGAVPAEAKP